MHIGVCMGDIGMGEIRIKVISINNGISGIGYRYGIGNISGIGYRFRYGTGNISGNGYPVLVRSSLQ